MKYHSLKVVAYARSDIAGGRGLTEAMRQLAHIRTFCVAHKMSVVSSAIERSSCLGMSEDQRDLDGLLDRACSGERPFDAIVVASACRVARDLGKFQACKDRLSAAGVLLLTVEDDAARSSGGRE